MIHPELRDFLPFLGRGRGLGQTRVPMAQKRSESRDSDLFVPGSGLFSKEFLADLDRIWALRYYIPDPNRPNYSENI